jgi:hypothetical protein
MAHFFLGDSILRFDASQQSILANWSGPLLGELTFSGIISSKGRHCGVGALLLSLGQSATSLRIGLDRLLCDVGLIDWSMPFSVQGVPSRGMGDTRLPDPGEDIRAVVVVVSNEMEGDCEGGMRIRDGTLIF